MNKWEGRVMPTNFIDFFKQRERGGTQNKKKVEEEEEVNKKHKSNLTDMRTLHMLMHSLREYTSP